MNLRRTPGAAPYVIGHRGAALVAPENTLESLAAAVDAGAHAVEFDVGPSLELAHSPHERPSEPVSLDEALAFLVERQVVVQVDVKERGYEREVVAAIGRHDLAGRVFVSTAFAGSCRRFAELAPQLPRAIGYPRDSLGVSRFTWPGWFTTGAAASLRQAMPVRIPLLLRSSRATVLSLHHTLCSRAAIAVAHRLGAPVLGWTANDPATVERLALLGVDAVVSDDPRLALEVVSNERPGTLGRR